MTDDASRAAAATLKAACHAAYRAHPGSCSNAVHEIVSHLVDPGFVCQPANAMIDALRRTWTAIDADTAGALAARGEVVVGGRKGSPNGHVIIVYPGAPKPRGGYAAVGRDGSEHMLPLEGSYPLAMSTSLGKWPGAMSDGDKTVWDPWGSDAAFAGVGFWHKPTAPSAPAEAADTVRMTLSDGYAIEIPRGQG